MVDAPPEDRGRVFFGAWVTVCDDESGEESTYRIVGPDEADARVGTISLRSPLGAALLGCRVGDERAIDLPKGRRQLSVISIRYGAAG